MTGSPELYTQMQDILPTGLTMDDQVKRRNQFLASNPIQEFNSVTGMEVGPRLRPEGNVRAKRKMEVKIHVQNGQKTTTIKIKEEEVNQV